MKDKAADIHEEIKQLQNKILEVGGDQLRRQTARVKDIEDQIEVMNDAFANFENKLKAAKKNLDKSTKLMDNAQKELEEIDAELKAIQSDVESKTEKAMQVQETSAEAKEVRL